MIAGELLTFGAGFVAAWLIARSLAGRMGATRAREEKGDVVSSLAAELDARSQTLRLILDHVGEGFLTIDRAGVISAERSAIVQTWLGVATEGTTFWDYLAATDPQAAAWFKLSWDALLDGFLPLELTLDQMPKTLLLRASDSVLRIRYSPILVAGEIDKVLLVISNVTHEVRHAKAEAAQREFIGVFDRVVKDKAGFLEFFNEGSELVRQITSGGEDRTVVLRAVHTLKGNCGFFGVTRIAEMCDRIETSMTESGGDLEADGNRELTLGWQHLSSTLRSLLGHTKNCIEVDVADLERLRTAVLCGRGRVDVADIITSFGLEPAERRLARIAEHARGLATRLGKPDIIVRTEGNGLRLDTARWATFWSTFAHCVRNAVDHGIESPAQRRLVGKFEVGAITLRTMQQGSDIVVEIADDGRGIDWIAVGAKARASGLPCSTLDDLREALFQDGISTGTTVTEYSGRGIGMGAMRAACAALGGTMRISTIQGKGTTLTFRIPSRAVVAPTTAADTRITSVASPALA